MYPTSAHFPFLYWLAISLSLCSYEKAITAKKYIYAVKRLCICGSDAESAREACTTPGPYILAHRA